MKTIINIVKSSDFLGDPITFTIDREKTPKTFSGGIISNLLLLFIIVLFILQANDSLKLKNPSMSSYLNVKKSVFTYEFK